MIQLEWRRTSDKAWLAPNTPITFGKSVFMRGAGYGPPVSDPVAFSLHRVASPLVAWGQRQEGKPWSWELARRPVHRDTNAPIPTFDSEAVILAPAGVFHTHRWAFHDDHGWSPILRTTRVSSIKASLKGEKGPVGGSIEATVGVAVDPMLRIDIALPWDDSPSVMPVTDLLRGELVDLQDVGKFDDSPSAVIDRLSAVLPSVRPTNVDLEWSPVEVSLNEGEVATAQLKVQGQGSTAFAFAFVSIQEGEVVGSSDIVVFWRDAEGVVSLFGGDS